MVNRLYYNDSYLTEFEAEVVDVRESVREQGRSEWQIALDRTAFYPTSGGQPFDTGILEAAARSGAIIEVPIHAVHEDDGGEIWHTTEKVLQPGVHIRGRIDRQRRRDHMQQHTGQHILSAAFLKLFDYATVSFHLGIESCTIDLSTANLSREHVQAAQQLANETITANLPVTIEYATVEEARARGVRKIPDRHGEMRLIHIAGVDLNACGGTHVSRTGEIGAILLRSIEKVTQGMRVEFVCGDRAIRAATHDFDLLSRSAALLSAPAASMPETIERLQEQGKAAAKEGARLLEEIAVLEAAKLFAEASDTGEIKVVQHVSHRDLAFTKLLASNITHSRNGVIALLASDAGQPGVVIAQSGDMSKNLGAVLKEALAEHGLKGGGSKDMAQGGLNSVAQIDTMMRAIATRLGIAVTPISR